MDVVPNIGYPADALPSWVLAFHAHAVLFGAGALKSASADKGYWSVKNQSALIGRGVRENGMQRPVNVNMSDWSPTKQRYG